MEKRYELLNEIYGLYGFEMDDVEAVLSDLKFEGLSDKALEKILVIQQKRAKEFRKEEE